METAPPIVDTQHRLDARVRPRGGPVMYQQWRDLLFLHWEFPASVVQETLPAGLHVDTFDGRAFVGVVPFFMRNVRPRFLPAVPGISHFMEMNLRTYVYDKSGVPGVWFYSLDANQSLAVALARRFFHLPYERAHMSARHLPGGTISYRSTRKSDTDGKLSCQFEYATESELAEPAADSLEFFLVERYRLYAFGNGRLWRGAVAHKPYPLCQARVTAWDENLLPLDGLPRTNRSPDHIIMSRGVDVDVFGLEPV